MPEKSKKPRIPKELAINKARFRKLYFDRAAGKAFFTKFIGSHFVKLATLNLALTGITQSKIGQANYRKIINAYRRIGRSYLDFISGKTDIIKHASFSSSISMEIWDALKEGGVPQLKRSAFLRTHIELLEHSAADLQLLMLKGIHPN